MGDLYLTVAGWDDRDDLVIERTVGDAAGAENWGLVTFDRIAGKPVLELYLRSGGGDWRFDLDEVNAILARAKQRIIEVAGPIAPETPEPAPTDVDDDAVVAVPAATG